MTASSTIETEPHTYMQETCYYIRCNCWVAVTYFCATTSSVDHECDDISQNAPMLLVAPVLGHIAARLLCGAPEHEREQEAAHTNTAYCCRMANRQSTSDTEPHQGTKRRQLDH